MNKMKKLGILLKKPSFTRLEAEKLGVSGESIAYYVKKGIIERIGPGIYFDPSKDIRVDIKWLDLVRIVYSVKNGVICLLSALDIYELTDEIPREFWIAIPQSKRAPAIPKTRFVRFRNIKLGKTIIKLGNVQLHIYDKERTVIDAFRYLDRELAIISLKKLIKQGIDYKKLSEYGKKLRINIDSYILAITT